MVSTKRIFTLNYYPFVVKNKLVNYHMQKIILV